MVKKTLIAIVLIFFNLSLFASESLVLTLKENIKELESKYHALKKKAKTVNDNIELLSREIEILRTKRRMLYTQKKETESQIEILEKEIEKINREIDTSKRYLKKRLLQIYKKGDYLILESLLTPKKEEDYIHTLNSLAYLSEKDKKSLIRLNELLAEKEQKSELLRFEKNNLETQIKELDLTNTALKERLKEQKRLYRKLKRKKSAYASLLKERNRLLKLLVESLSKKPTPQNPSAIPMDKFKRLLDLPVRGKIIERFGTYRIGRYKTKIKNNGITLKVRKGKKVKAFYDGAVVFADWYKSYGKLVIIDHGFGYYTFYAHLDKIFVKINQTVSKGEVIGLTGNTASLSGSVFHFEIWHNKKPLNPLKWIKRR